MLVEGCLLVELKSVQDVLPVHKAQLFSYMKLLNVPLGLLFNFHEPKLTSGIHRMMLPGSSGKYTEFLRSFFPESDQGEPSSDCAPNHLFPSVQSCLG